MRAHATTVDHVVAGPPADTLPRFGRRGGPLLDFVSANFLYILTTVAVVAVAAGAFLAYERHTYSRDLRTVMTTIASTTTAGARLNTITWTQLAGALPANIPVVEEGTAGSGTGLIEFGGLLAGGLPLRIYGGNDNANYPQLGAGSARQLILVIGDTNNPANDSAGVCQDIARTVGPGVRTVQLLTNADDPPATALFAGGVIAATPVPTGDADTVLSPSTGHPLGASPTHAPQVTLDI